MLSPRHQQHHAWRAARLLATASRREAIRFGTLGRTKRNFHAAVASVLTVENNRWKDLPTAVSVSIHHCKHTSWNRFSSTTTATATSTALDHDATNSNDTLTTAPTESNKSKSRSSTFRAYSDLAKAKLSALVVSTTAIGFVAAGGPLSCPWTLASCCLGTALLSSSAAAWNQILEIDRDQRMKRTQMRPLVQGTIISPAQAKLAAVAWGVTGASMLVVGTNPVTATLGVANLALYAGPYTYLKPRSIYNTWVGAVVGAIPPLMGWTAAANLIAVSTATGTSTGAVLATATVAADWFTSMDVLFQQLQHQLPLEAWWLAGVLYLWQMPHFLALSYMHRIDYRRGGFKMVSTVYPPETSARLITRYAWYLTAMPFVAAGLLETTSSMFAMEGILLNAYALRAAYKFQYDQSNANARHVFLTSLWYLPSLLMLYLLHSKVWDQDKESVTAPPVKDILRDYLSDWIHQVRSKGRQVCVHEQAAIKAKTAANHTNENTDDKHQHYHESITAASKLLACPVVVGKHVSQNSVVEVATHAGKEVVAAAEAAATAATTSLEGVESNTGGVVGSSDNP